MKKSRTPQPVTVISGIILFTAGAIMAGETNPVQSDQRLADVVNKGLAFLSEKGPAFQNEKSCVTCHHGPLTVWGQSTPATLGFSIDQAAANEFKEELLKEWKGLSKGYDGKQWSHTLAAFFVLGQPEDWEPARQPEITAALIDAITRNQQKDGYWKAAKQFSGQTRPKGEADLLQTMWNLNALSRLEDFDDSLASHRESALRWIRNVPDPESMDARAIRLLTEHRFGEQKNAENLLWKMLADQNEDGSWGWNGGGEGDAWATGITLYVLSFFDSEAPSKSIEAARSFLVSSQSEDGSWLVPTKLVPDKTGKKEHGSAISSYFGTVWSVMGIARTLGRNQQTSSFDGSNENLLNVSSLP